MFFIRCDFLFFFQPLDSDSKVRLYTSLETQKVQTTSFTYAELIKTYQLIWYVNEKLLVFFCSLDQNPVIMLPHVNLFSTADWWWLILDLTSTLCFASVGDWSTNNNWNADPCITAGGKHCWYVYWMSVSLLFYLWVETEGFGRFPNTQQVKYDLLHCKIKSLLNKEQTNRIFITQHDI